MTSANPWLRSLIPGAGALRAPGLLACTLVLLAIHPHPGAAQELTERTPNLSGGWVGEPGSAHFHLLHRFWLVGSGNVANSPTMVLALPLPGRLLAGAQFASNSGIAPGEANESEAFLRWAAPSPGTLPVEPAVTGAFNAATGSVDGELSVVAPFDRARLLGAARVFSDARDSGDAGWALAGGLTVQVSDHVALAGDYGAAWIDGNRGRPVWGAGVHLQIPTTPHTLSLQATNTRTSTLQGSSFRTRTLWGFEFTIPITFARYRSRPAAPTEAVPADAGVREVTMTNDLRFAPEVLEIRVGETVTWRNTTSVLHTVTAHPDRVPDPDQIALPDGAEPFDSGNMPPGAVFEHTFTVPGEYVYICVPHAAIPQIGSVRVLP